MQCAQEAILLPGIVIIILDETSVQYHEDLESSHHKTTPCILPMRLFAKENNTVVTVIFCNLGAKLFVKYFTNLIGFLS